jgi:hypothetical protein
MNKKGSMELSVNSIVILVIAIVMLGLILGFVRSKFADVNKQISISEPDAPDATPSNVLTVSREIITASPGETIALKVQAYDAEGSASDVSPTVDCGTSTFVIAKTEVISKTIAAGTSEKYIMTIKIPSVAKDKYLCSVKMNLGTSTSFTATKDIVFEII